ncbi:MAG: NAD(P)H-dependent oxidoreductase [Methanofollis sp.]|uniref:NAD(P)H-dependent oxidoreductase n=1 Tax=Methanofollis sp. TaxID=2052835 RepID=UPI0026202092|nr:NAD(P)H-dependent oxidoreductase [Methanofollis sp.]MDD4254789.1 NAD(P)H-dependent oxidoreductase [Methanofollis sp.]
MFISVILAHPHRGSFNHAIAETVVAALRECGHAVAFHDLYAETFDPVLPYDEIARDAPLPPFIAAHCAEIAVADGLVVVHPDWWGMPPSILKGWIDRVLRPGVAYRFGEGDNGEGISVGLLKAKTALVFNTSNTPKQRELAIFGDPLQRLWKDCICTFCGIPIFHRRMFDVMVASTEEQRKSWLGDVRALTCETFPPDSA